MQLSNLPARIYAAFAGSGTKNTIPIPSQISITPGAASYTDGFPPLTFTPVASGGVPPFGADFNGIFNAITAIQQWQCGGGMFEFDSTWSTDNGGYPKGALLLKATGSGYWVNLVDNNTVDPDTVGTNWSDLGALLTTAPLKSVAPVPYNSTSTIAAGDVNKIITCSSGSAITISLPTAPVAGNFVYLTNIASSLITISRSGTQLIYALGNTGATTMPLGNSDSVALVFDGTNWIQAWGASQSGAGQSWQTLTGSRALSTAYPNSTGKEIKVNVLATTSVAGQMMVATVGAATLYGSNQYGSTYSAIFFTVPPGVSYSVALASGTLSTWSEQR